MKRVGPCIVVALICAAAAAAQEPGDLGARGTWRAWLDCPGGELGFGLELERADGEWRARLVNGAERIEVSRVEWIADELVLNMEHYDSSIRARLNADDSRLDGEWTKRQAANDWTRMAFHAVRRGEQAGPASIGATDSGTAINGRWSVRFAESEDPAVGIFATKPDGSATGTFMTTTGDYRYLAGTWGKDELELSCFDGAHAFLFRATLGEDELLRGDFWSRDTWHETWTARRDPEASLPDAFAQTQSSDRIPLSSLVFLDLDGNKRSLGDPEFAGKARIIEVFGSWCPNCNDSAAYLVELDRRYRDRGLSIVGLAFELTGNHARDACQVVKFAERHNIRYPILIAGTADKGLASRALPFLDRLRSYPTTIFLDASGGVRAVHTGYTGPATKEAYNQLRERFESIIEELLADSDSSASPP